MKKSLLVALILLFLINIDLVAQNRTITGVVISGEDDLPLPGVNVVVKGTSRGAITDLEGNYSIQAANEETLVFSYVGFVAIEANVGNRNSIDITLQADATVLGEVVIVGYGSITKGDLTGNIASIKGAEIANVPVPNFTEALQGRMAGVFVESSSGKVGEGVKIRIRGTTSISGGNEPLYVIDGIPITSDGTLGYSNPLSDINFNDIESFEVLKDASAAAIYGARGANGVVLITTKTGSAGKTRFNVGFQRGVSSPTRLREFLNAAEYIELFSEAGRNVGDLEFVESRFNQYSGHSDWRTGETDTDWQKLAFNDDAGITNFNFSASGGDARTQFYASGSYDKQDGILIRNNFERISGRLNLDHKVSDRFSIGANFGLARTVTNRLTADNAFNNPIQLVALSPITPVRDLNGELYDRPVATYYNNLIDSENASWSITGFRNFTNVFGELLIFKDLKFRSEFGADITNQNQERYFGSKTNTGLSINGYGYSEWLRIFNYNTNNYFTYTPTIGERHSLELTLGMSFQKSQTNITNAEGQGFPLDDLKTLASAAEITGGSSTLSYFSFLSYFARANYKLADKYLFTLSGRVDASSRFGSNNRYGFFPAASAGWLLSEEDFLKENSTLSLLKLRGSYGLTGNAEIGNFDHLGLYGAGSYGLQSALSPSQIPNPNLGWEKTRQLDIGIEFGLFNDRITGELDYYDKNTSDLLLNVPIPGTSGFSTQTQNIGKMRNYGFEVVLNTTNIVRGQFSWTTSFNFARNINEVVELTDPTQDREMIPSADSRFFNFIIAGEPISVFYGPAYAGVDPDNGDALWYLDDTRTETTNSVNAAERQVIGDPNPRFITGLNNSITYKDFDLGFLFQAVYGNDIYEGGGGFHSANGDWFDNQTRDQLRRWQNPGDITDVPQARLGEGNGAQPSSRYISDGSYLRFKTLSFGYTLPLNVAQRIGMTSVRVYFIGQNLLTFTKYNGWDPEVNADYLGSTTSNTNRYQGNDFYSAPQARTYSLGINIGF